MLNAVFCKQTNSKKLMGILQNALAPYPHEIEILIPPDVHNFQKKSFPHRNTWLSSQDHNGTSAH
jgi:hypothetical protein